MTFFQKNADKLAPLTLSGKAKYRDCQVGAAWATLAHFTASSEPALISMPTGSGKTNVMIMLSFLLKADRVIIVTPSVTLRGQIAKKFSSMEDMRSISAYPDSAPRPNVKDHKGKLDSDDAWKEFLNYDVVVVTPHTTSSGYDSISPPPKDLFSTRTLLFIDEAHHSRARTWNDLIASFADLHVILLTATPFRNDNRRLLAKLIYHYPMRKAMETGIYSTIKYHAVEPTDPKNKDKELCDKALQIFNSQKKKYPMARLLIRAEGVQGSKNILELYRKAGLVVEEVNYQRNIEDNEDAIEKVRLGQIDGIVCVNQVGEGIDIPNLKVAVLHKPRQSFPATVQFVGRISREPTIPVGEPHLIACPDDVQGQLRKLYTQDNAWRELVPDLVEKIVGKVTKRTSFHKVVDVETEIDVDVNDLTPFFSVRVYHSIDSRPLLVNSVLDLKEDITTVFQHIIPGTSTLVLITSIERTFPWVDETVLSAPHYDLHVYYWNPELKLLFESTTSDKIASSIRNSLWGESAKRIKADRVTKALQQASTSQYLMFGLSNLSKASGSVPSYKTYIGSYVEGAVRPSDSRSFTAGHALTKYNTGETRGIATNQARVWSIKRDHITDFTDWCDRIGNCINKRGDSRLPNVEFLPVPKSIDKFPSKPLAVYMRWDPNLQITLRSSSNNFIVESTDFEKVTLSPDKKFVMGILRFGGEKSFESTAFTFNTLHPHWIFKSSEALTLQIDDGEKTLMSTLEEFLDDNPPIFVLEDRSTIINGSRFEPGIKLSTLPSKCLDFGFDWSGCDINLEFPIINPNPKKSVKPKAGKLAVQDYLEQWLMKSATGDTLIIKDHASGEIADFIEVMESSMTIKFYHCKACSPKKSPGARISELKVIEQVLRSIIYIGTNSLISELYRRVTENQRPNTRMVYGTSTNLKNIGKKFQANRWTFEVCIVNPGIDLNRSIRAENTNTLLIACYEWLGAANASLKIIGS